METCPTCLGRGLITNRITRDVSYCPKCSGRGTIKRWTPPPSEDDAKRVEPTGDKMLQQTECQEAHARFKAALSPWIEQAEATQADPWLLAEVKHALVRSERRATQDAHDRRDAWLTVGLVLRCEERTPAHDPLIAWARGMTSRLCQHDEGVLSGDAQFIGQNLLGDVEQAIHAVNRSKALDLWGQATLQREWLEAALGVFDLWRGKPWRPDALQDTDAKGQDLARTMRLVEHRTMRGPWLTRAAKLHQGAWWL